MCLHTQHWWLHSRIPRESTKLNQDHIANGKLWYRVGAPGQGRQPYTDKVTPPRLIPHSCQRPESWSASCVQRYFHTEQAHGNTSVISECQLPVKSEKHHLQDNKDLTFSYASLFSLGQPHRKSNYALRDCLVREKSGSGHWPEKICI